MKAARSKHYFLKASTRDTWAPQLEDANSEAQRGRARCMEAVKPKGKVCLSLGCGLGRFLRDYISSGARLVVGIDINRQNLLICKKTRAELILCDIENLPIRDTAIDALECVATLEHVPSPWRAVKEASRVLRRDEGLAFITFPHYEWTKAVNDSKIAWKLVLSLRDLICDLTCILIPVAVRRAIFNINLIGFRTYGRTCHAGFSFQSILRIYRDAHMQVVEANWCPAQQLLEVIASPK